MSIMPAEELAKKREYREAKARAGLVRFITDIPAEDKELIAQVQFDRALRTRGNALSAILTEWQEFKNQQQENTATI